MNSKLQNQISKRTKKIWFKKKKREADLRTHVPSKQWKLLPNGNMDLVLKMFQFFKRS